MLMAGTIFLSQSLGGILAFSGQMLVLALGVLLRREKPRTQLLLLSLLVVVLGAWLVMLSPGGIAERVARLHDPLGKTGAADRLVIVKDSLKMIAVRPVLGWGLGTFPTVYPKFRSFYTNYFVNEAHNDYVQTAVETGLVGFAIVCWFIALFFRVSLRNTEHWRSDVRDGVCLAAVIAVTGILIHSFSDFNLRIPANAALFFALAAVASGNFEKRAFKQPRAADRLPRRS
jgi:O-antigen ligase